MQESAFAEPYRNDPLDRSGRNESSDHDNDRNRPAVNHKGLRFVRIDYSNAGLPLMIAASSMYHRAIPIPAQSVSGKQHMTSARINALSLERDGPKVQIYWERIVSPFCSCTDSSKNNGLWKELFYIKKTIAVRPKPAKSHFC